MADDDISVAINASIDGLTASMEQAGDDTQDAMGKITEAAGEAGDALDEKVAKAAEQAKEKLAELGGEGQTLSESFEGLKESISGAFEATGIALAAEAIHKVGEELEVAMDRATQMKNMSDVLGINTDQFQVLQEAAKEAGVAIGTVSRTAVRLKVDFDDARDGSAAATEKLLTLGFSLDQIHDKAFDENAALSELGERLRDASTHADTLSAIQKEFGSRAALVVEVLKNYDGSLAGVAKGMDAVNGLSEAEIERLHELHGFWARVGTTIADTTAKLLVWNATPTTFSVDESGGLVAEVEQAKEAGVQKVATAEQTAQAQSAASHKALLAQMEDDKTAVSAAKSGTQEKVDAAIKYVEAVTSLYGATSDAAKKAVAEEEKIQQEYNDKVTADAAESAAAQLKYEEKLAHDREDTVKKSVTTMDKDWKEFFAQYTKGTEIQLKAAEDVSLGQIAAATKAVQAQIALKQLDPTQGAQMEVELAQEKLAAENVYFEAMKRNYSDDANKQAEYQMQEVQATTKAAAEMVAAQQKAALDTQHAWDQAVKPMESAFSTALQGMAAGTENFRTAFKNVMDSIVKDIFSSSINAMVHQWLTGEQTKTVATEIQNKLRLADTTASATATKTVNAQVATTDITTKAAQSAAGAFSAMVSIPYVGPVLAVAAMVAAEAAVMALIGKIASAEGGMVVDHDQLAMVHEDEMILPRHISQGINEKILNPEGSSGNSMAGGSGNTYHIHAHDARSFEKYLSSQRNRNTVAAAMKKASVRGNRSLRST